MSEARDLPAPSRPPVVPPSRRGVAWLAAGVLLAAGVTAGVAAWRWPRQAGQPQAGDGDPRLTFPTPYRNVRPEVQYVGDGTCAGCHADIAETFHKHPMGQSMLALQPERAGRRQCGLGSFLPDPVGPLLVRGGWAAWDGITHNPFEKFGNEYAVERRPDGRVWHREARRDAGGRVVAAAVQEARFRVGSGVQGYSYLVERQGCAFMSPVSWYAHKQRWDISPGFAPDLHFDRSVTVRCLFCHANKVEPVEDTINRYQEPLFRGLSIGCERCHGPGELHARARERGDALGTADPTIVNPTKLDPVLRDAVCEQCHLEGEAEVLRRGRGPFDFRPGLPLQLFWSVFVRRPGLPSEMNAVSHVEQMHVSGCYLGGKGEGRMGCTSCHDPHVLPAPAEAAAYYRARCAACHKENDHGCSLAPGARLRQNGNDCVACHMPKSPTADVAHTAVTDHRVPRRPLPRQPGPAPMRPRAAGEVPLVAFHRDLPGPDGAEADRDLGLALIYKARSRADAAAVICQTALPYLEGALRAWPRDVPSWEGKGYALWKMGHPAEAVEAYEMALTLAPEREQSLADAALVLARLDRDRESLALWQHALQIDPTCSDYLLNEAKVLSRLRDWSGSAAAARKVLALNPLLTQPRALIVVACVRTGQERAARAEFEALMALHTDDAPQLRRELEPELEAMH